MKTILGHAGVAAVAAAALLAGTAARAADVPEHHFKGIASFSSSPVYQTRAKPFWEEQIKAASNGKITADVLTIDQLGFKGEEVFRMLQLGLFDFVTNVMSFAAGDDPRNEALDLAGIALDLDEHKKMADAYRPVLAKLYEEKYNLHLMGLWPIGPVVVWCNTPVTSLADLSGKKVRGFNKTMSDFLQAVGAVPVSMSFGDMVTALERGTIDCAITSPRSGLKAGVAEVTTHMLPVSLGWATVIDAINTGVWQRLDPATKELLETEYAKLQADVYKKVDEETEDAYRCITGKEPCNDPGAMKAPLTLTKLSDADRAKVREVVRDKVLPAWAGRCGGDCVERWNETVGKAADITLSK